MKTALTSLTFKAAICALFATFAAPMQAQDAPNTAQAAQTRGPVTNLPMPRFVSLKATKANARRGPSLSHRIN